jgi:S1-C subfamily serine protease
MDTMNIYTVAGIGNQRKLLRLTSRIATASTSLVIFLFSFAGRQASGGEQKTLEHSVVKIYVTMQSEDFSMPWQSRSPQSGNGSGFVINGHRIMSNAHVVSNARFIEVKKNGSPRRFAAHVKFAAHDCDLAVLEVEDPAFFEGTTPVKFAKDIPKLSDKVAVIGYPMGGSRISLTEGVVSRIDYNTYAHSGVDDHLVLQVDAAINHGNSGGPVMLKGRVVGVAFQGMMSGNNIGYAIPVPIIKHFLADIADGKYNGYPSLGTQIMDTRNLALRKSLGIAKLKKGVAVSWIDPFGSARGILKAGDVLLEIDGHDIAADGTIRLDGNLIGFMELIERRQWGDKVQLKIMRDGAVNNVDIALTNPDDPYVFRTIYDKRPEYFIVGGLVFSPLTRNYLVTLGRNINGINQQQLLYFNSYSKVDGLWRDRSQFVVLVRRLPHSVNSYTEPFMQGVLAEVNGVHIGCMADLIKAIKTPQKGYHIIRFEGMDDYIVLDAVQAQQADKEIMKSYGVPELSYLAEEQK